MKRINLALAVFAAALLSSCMEEKSFNDKTIGENDIVFTLQGAPATRSMEDMSIVRKGATLELAANGNGHKLFLEETIEDLNRVWAPATKGTPAYTENVGVLYRNKLSVYAASLGDASYESMDEEMVGGGWRYNHHYASDPWANGAVDFYFRMPSDMASHGVTLGTDAYGKDSNNNLTITFGYESPAEAKDQQDIIFAARNVTKSQYTKTLPNGVPVLFNHALAAVKFAIANSEEASITSIEFTGLVGKGTCTITPAKENDYHDNTGSYSSADAVNWTLDKTATGATYSSGDFGDPVGYTTGSFANNGDYPSSFAGAGAAQNYNLNDADATQTFWFIPQAMTDKVMLHIKYTYGGNEGEGDIEFGKALAGVTWQAGQLRTYTLRVDEVNVIIQDVVDIVDPEEIEIEGADDGQTLDSYKGSTKSDVVISNIGNTDVYIRAALIGQWLDEESGDPVFGYTDFTSGEFKYVASWYQDQFGTDAPHDQGEFEGLIGYDLSASDYWEKRGDFYYYKYVVPAYTGTIPGAYKTVANGKATDVAAPSPVGNQPLFISYTVGDAPASTVAGQVKQIYFQLEIATQAISAKNSDGTYLSMDEAWNRANTPDPSN